MEITISLPILILSTCFVCMLALALCCFFLLIQEEKVKVDERDAEYSQSSESMGAYSKPYSPRAHALRQRAFHSTDNFNNLPRPATMINTGGVNVTKPPLAPNVKPVPPLPLNNYGIIQQRIPQENKEKNKPRISKITNQDENPVIFERFQQSAIPPAIPEHDGDPLDESSNLESTRNTGSNSSADMLFSSPPPAVTRIRSGLRGSRPLVTSPKPLELVAGMRRRNSESDSEEEGEDGSGSLTVYNNRNNSSSTSSSSPLGSHSRSSNRRNHNTSSPVPSPSPSPSSQKLAPASIPQLLQPIPFQDLHLSHVLGGGSFGQVWQGVWKGTPVAVKVLSASTNVPSNIMTAFEAEVTMLASLRHPNICLYIGACLTSQHRALVLELVSRGSLWHVLRTPGLFPEHAGPQHWPWPVTRRVVEGCCRGLVYLHALSPPILHRDLKSANLLLDDSFHVKICDFGLARLRQLDLDQRGAMTAQVGTYQWMAPEVIAGVKDYTESADVYSLVVVIWEILTGLCPFDELPSNQIATRVVQGYRPPIPAFTPPSLSHLIQICWSAVPTDRWSAEAVLNSVSKAFDDILANNHES